MGSLSATNPMLMSITIIIMIAYLAVATGLGMLLASRTRTPADWATGGGAMGIGMIVAGVAGTRIGGVGTYGVAGDVMTSGLWNLWYAVNTFLALALVGFFFVIPYRRLKLTTVSELFIKRFGQRRSSTLTSLCVQTEYLIINIIEPYVIGLIISNVTGIGLTPAIFIGAFVIISYTALSGLRGTAATNVLHCLMVVVGLGAVAWVAMGQLGGWGAVVATATSNLKSAGVDFEAWWSFVGLGWLPIIAMFFSATVHTPAASIYVNYAASARNERMLLPAFLLAGLLAALMPLLSGVIGIEAVARYGVDDSIRSYASITAVALDAGPLIGGIALAAILAALISSGGPILLASATLFVNDWLPMKSDEENGLRRYRIATVVYGLLAATIAAVANISSVLDLLLLGFALVVPPAVAIAFVLYWRKTTEQGAFWGIAAGYVTGVMAWAIGHWWTVPDPSYWTTLVPLVVVPVVSLQTRTSEDPFSVPFYRQLKGRADRA